MKSLKERMRDKKIAKFRKEFELISDNIGKAPKPVIKSLYADLALRVKDYGEEGIDIFCDCFEEIHKLMDLSEQQIIAQHTLQFLAEAAKDTQQRKQV